MQKISLLIVGDFSKGNSANFIYEAFKKRVNKIYKSNNDSTKQMWSKKSLFYRIMHRLRLPNDDKRDNKLIKKYVDSKKVNTILIIKGNHIKPSTLSYVKDNRINLLSWSDDDMFNVKNRSVYYDNGLKYYDLVVTQKSYNCNPDELPLLGAKRVFFRNKAYAKSMHTPYKNCKKSRYQYEVLFIGSYENQRAESLIYLARNGVSVDVYGPHWNKFKENHNKLIIHNKLLVAEDYVQAISCSKISLCFLRKVNRDLQTSRTMEIPASGGFMLAERTSEHLSLFKEGIEAVYFDSNQELLSKVKYYLGNNVEREKISIAGRDRCKNDTYSYDDRALEILTELAKINE
jgi:spore maturation protein CgeB